MGSENNKGRSAPPERGGSLARDRRVILAVFAAALLVRAVSGWACGAAAPQEIRYITIAQGILADHAFAGIDTRFPDIIQPPVYPVLTAAAVALLRDPLLAGRGVSILMGSLLVFPIATLARRIFGPSAGRRAAWLVAVYPLLTHISGLTLTEPTFTVFIAMAAVRLHRVVAGDGRPLREGAVAGLWIGLAFLTRPEGLTYLVAGCAILFLSARGAHRWSAGRAAGLAGTAAACFLIFALPYSAWLRAQTGHWLIAPKAVLSQVHNWVMTEGLKEGWPEGYGTTLFYERVKFGLNDEGTDLRTSELFRAVGLMPLRPGEAARPLRVAGEVIQPGHLVRVVVGNLKTLYLQVVKSGLAIPTLLMGFVAIGMTARPWVAGPFRRGHLMLLLLVASGGSWVFSNVQTRFLYPSAAFVIPWMAEGWCRLEDWVGDSFGRGGARWGFLLWSGRAWLIGGVVAAACLAHTIPPARTMASAWPENRDAGIFLSREGAPGERVMALTPVVSFYAGMSFEVMPYADVDRLLAYARHKGVRYLIADAAEFPRFRPQLASLVDPATAPPDLFALHAVGDGARTRLIVYELRRQEKRESADAAPPIE